MTAGFAIARNTVCVIGTYLKEGKMTEEKAPHSLGGSGGHAQHKPGEGFWCSICGRPATKCQVRKDVSVYFCDDHLNGTRPVQQVVAQC